MKTGEAREDLPGAPSLAPCRTSDPKAQHQQQASILLPNSLDSNSSTPTAYPLSALLSPSLLQALGSPHVPASPNVQSTTTAKPGPKGTPELPTPTPFSAAATSVQPEEGGQGQSVVQACLARGMNGSQAEAVAHFMSQQPGMNVDTLLAALPSCGANAGSSALPAELIQDNPNAAAGTGSTRSSNTSLGSNAANSSSSCPVLSSSDALSSSSSVMNNKATGDECAKEGAHASSPSGGCMEGDAEGEVRRGGQFRPERHSIETTFGEELAWI